MLQTLDLQQFTGRLAEIPRTTEQEILWYEGNLKLLELPLASVVGTREVSASGIARTRRLTSLLVEEGFCIVSGLAKGVDRVAHEMALQMNGYTIAVMGTPIDECYPREHRALKNEISCRGLILSQFAPRTPVLRSNFPRRNILMAALSSVTFVVEATIDSGTRHQVKAAVARGTPVAFLASLVDQNYTWVHAALETGYGFIIERPEDARRLLEQASRAPSVPTVSAGSQRDFDFVEQEATAFELPKVAKASSQGRSEEGAESKTKRGPDFEMDRLALVLPSPHRKRDWWKKVWNRLFAIIAPQRRAMRSNSKNSD